MSSLDKRNRSADEDEFSNSWTYKTNDMESQNYFDKAATESIDLHGLTIRDVADRHVENFLEAIEHELVDKFMKTFSEKTTAAINEHRSEIRDLQRKHDKEQDDFESELLKLNEEMAKNVAELEDFIATE